MSKKIKRWEIWYADVKFEDSDEIKRRPVLVYNNVTFAIVSYKMTSTDRGDGVTEYRVKEWKEAGLDNPTSVRIDKVLRLKEQDFIKKIGQLTVADIMQFQLRIDSRK